MGIEEKANGVYTPYMNKFKYLITCYDTNGGQIIFRYSTNEVKEVEQKVNEFQPFGDVIVINAEHWVYPTGSPMGV